MLFHLMLMWRGSFRFLYTILWPVFSKGKVGVRDAVVTTAESINSVVLLPLWESYPERMNGPLHAVHYRMMWFFQSSFYCGRFFCILCLVAYKPTITINLVINRTSGKGAVRVAHMQAACIECLEWQFSFPRTTQKVSHHSFFKTFLSERVIYNVKIFISKWKKTKNKRKIIYELSFL